MESFEGENSLRTWSSPFTSVAPPMAKSGLPPPFPPSLPVISFTIWPARHPFSIACGEHRARTLTLSPKTAPRTTTEGSICLERETASPRKSFGFATSAFATIQLRPSICFTSLMSSSAWAAAPFC